MHMLSSELYRDLSTCVYLSAQTYQNATEVFLLFTAGCASHPYIYSLRGICVESCQKSLFHAVAVKLPPLTLHCPPQIMVKLKPAARPLENSLCLSLRV